MAAQSLFLPSKTNYEVTIESPVFGQDDIYDDDFDQETQYIIDSAEKFNSGISLDEIFEWIHLLQ